VNQGAVRQTRCALRQRSHVGTITIQSRHAKARDNRHALSATTRTPASRRSSPTGRAGGSDEGSVADRRRWRTERRKRLMSLYHVCVATARAAAMADRMLVLRVVVCLLPRLASGERRICYARYQRASVNRYGERRRLRRYAGTKRGDRARAAAYRYAPRCSVAGDTRLAKPRHDTAMSLVVAAVADAVTIALQ